MICYMLVSTEFLKQFTCNDRPLQLSYEQKIWNKPYQQYRVQKEVMEGIMTSTYTLRQQVCGTCDPKMGLQNPYPKAEKANLNNDLVLKDGLG